MVTALQRKQLHNARPLIQHSTNHIKAVPGTAMDMGTGDGWPDILATGRREGQQKDATTNKAQLLEKYEKDYASTADKMVEQLVKYAS